MKNSLSFLLVIICLALSCQMRQTAFAQAPRTIEIGPHFGATGYVGDLNVWRELKQWDWKHLHQFDYNVGALARFNLDPRWSFRMDYSYLKLNAQDAITAWVPSASQEFHSTLHDLSLIAEFNFLDYYTGRLDNSISPYLFGGVSGFFCNGSFDFNKNALNLSVPFGVGCKISITKRLASTVEWRMHYTLTDNLEDCDIAPYANNGANKDWFGMFNLSITYKFDITNGSLLSKLLLVLSPFYYQQRM